MKPAAVDFARHALDTESRTVRWHVSIFGVDKVSVHPSVAAILDRARPVGEARGEFLVRKALQAVIAEKSLRGEFLAVDADLRALVKPDAQSGAPRPQESENARSASIGDGAARDLLGARKAP